MMAFIFICAFALAALIGMWLAVRGARAEFRSLDRYVTFLGSFDENEQKVWTYFPASQRPELPFEKR